MCKFIYGTAELKGMGSYEIIAKRWFNFRPVRIKREIKWHGFFEMHEDFALQTLLMEPGSALATSAFAALSLYDACIK